MSRCGQSRCSQCLGSARSQTTGQLRFGQVLRLGKTCSVVCLGKSGGFPTRTPSVDTSRAVFDHVGPRVFDFDASLRFYTTVLAAIGHAPTHIGGEYPAWNDFSIAQASPERPATRGLHVAFVARSAEDVDAFWRTGL